MTTDYITSQCRRFRLACLFLACLLAPHPAAFGEYLPSKYIVVFNPGFDVDETVNDLAGRLGFAVSHRYRHALRGMAVNMPPQLMWLLAQDPRIAYIEQDVVISVAAQNLPTGVDRVNYELHPAAKIDEIDIAADRADVDIAILDTGIDHTHPDLNVYRYAYCKTQFFSVNCIEGDAGAYDGHGHGTHVAGTAAAVDNSYGVVGTAPGARVWAVKVLENDGNGSGAQLLAGVDYVTAHAGEIEVANMSLEGEGTFQPLEDAIAASVAAGVVYVVAAGNGRNDVSGSYPAGHPDAITVSALEDHDGQPGGLSTTFGDDTFGDYSNYGAGVDIMAPGSNILSTRAGGGLSTRTGTSMASPHVAGAAALYLAEHPGSSPQAVKNALLAAADPAPCVNGPGGTCADDPDGIQEPLLMFRLPANGDLNDDGIVDVRDILLGQRILTGLHTPSTGELERGDVAPLNGGVPASDGVFTAGDLLVIMRIASGDLTI